MAKEPISLIDDALPSQGMPLGGSQEEIEVEEIEEPTDMMEEEDGSVVLNFEEMVTEELQAEQAEQNREARAKVNAEQRQRLTEERVARKNADRQVE